MKTLSIIIPVYNEENTIKLILKRVVSVSLPGWKKEIIVVDDHSTDGTKEILKRLERQVSVYYKSKNEGKGSAVTVGLAKATGEVILIQDADLEYNPEDYIKLLTPFSDSGIQVVYGSRVLGAHSATKFVYALGNRFITVLTDFLYNTNISDSETGYKVFRRTILSSMTFRSKRFDFDQEFTAKVLKGGYTILEVPISYIRRTHKEGKKLTWRDGIRAIAALLRFRVTD